MDNGILYVVYNKWINNPETQEMPYKVGITRSSVDDRYYGLGLKMPGEFETLFAFKLDNCSKAEQLIHGILYKFRINGEWFNITQKEIDLIKTSCETMGGTLITDEIKKEIKIETDFIEENNLEDNGQLSININYWKNKIKPDFIKYMKEHYPEKSESTIKTIFIDAFYLTNTGKKLEIDFYKIIKNKIIPDNFIIKLEEYFNEKKNKGEISISPKTNAKGYHKALSYLLIFLNQKENNLKNPHCT